MKTNRCFLTAFLAGAANLFLAASVALAITVTEPPDYSGTPPGTAYTLTLGANTFSGSVNTTGGVDGQDNFQVTVPTGLRITGVSKNVTAVAGPAFGGFVTFNLNQTLTGTGPGNFTTGLPLSVGTYPVTVAASFSVGNPWSVTVTTGPAPDYSVTTAGGVISVTDDAGNGDVLTLSEPVAGQIKFAAPGRTFAVNGGALLTGDSGNLPLAGVTTININANGGADTINVSGFSGTSFPDLQISGGADDDTVNLNGDITFAPNKNLSVSAESANVAANANLLASGTGTIFVTCRRSVFLGGGASLETVNGTLSVQANQQNTATTGNFMGVNIDGATLRSTGSGAVTVKGRGGDDAGGSQLGVGIFNGAKIIGGSGAVNVTGTGGASANWINRGVTIYGAGSQITSTGGAVSVTGTAGAFSSFYGIGISLLFGGEISAGGSGEVSVFGTGAGVIGSGFNMGLEMGSPDSRITSAGGNVTVTAVAGDGVSWGVSLTNSSAIAAPAAGGNVIVEADSIEIDSTSSVSSAAAASSVTLQTHNTITRLNLGGADDNAGPPKVLGLTDAEIDRITTPTLILSSASFAPLTISAPISPAAAKNLTLNTPDASSPINASAAGTDITLPAGGVLKIDGPLAMPITSATPDSGFPQLKVVGGVNLNGKALDLTGTTFAGALGQTFTIIDNDGTDAVTGTFAGLPEGALLAWPGSSAFYASVSYLGGTGNDVVLTLVSALSVITTASDNSIGSLRAALTFAATTPGADTITFAPALSGQTITLGSEIVIADNDAVTIDASKLTAGLTISGGNATRLFTVASGKSLTLKNLTLTGGNGTGVLGSGNGGAILNLGALTLEDCTLTANVVPSTKVGGAIYTTNAATSVTARRCVFSANATTGNSSGGGAIFAEASSVLDCFDCTFTANTTPNTAGAVHASSGANATLTRCTFNANTATGAGSGAGAVRNTSATLTLLNCTLTANTAVLEGGAVLSVNSGTTTLRHCTIAGNSAANGGGIILFSGTVAVENCIVAGNTATTGPDIQRSGGAITRAGGSVIGDNASAAAAFPAGTPNPSGDQVGTTASPLNARLASLASNGGLTQTMALLPGSPALDKGAVIAGLTTDQRGFLRSRDGNAIAGALPDSGAYEAQVAPFSVGFNFIGGTNGPGGTLTSTEVAGLFPQANWNNLSTDNAGSTTGTAPNAASRNDSTGATIAGLKLWWDAPNVWSRAGTPTTPNEKLLWGYLDSNGNVNTGTDLYVANNQPFFAIASLPSALTLGGYRVLVYADGDSNDHVTEFWLASNRGQNLSNVSSETDLTTHRFRRDNTDASALVEVPATSNTDLGGVTPVGNVLRFDAMTESGFTVRAVEATFTNYPRAEINAVQIVRNEIIVVTTAADELDPVGTLGTGISLREALRDAPDGAGIVFDPAAFHGEPADTITFLAANPGLVLDKNLTIDASNIPGGVTVNAAASSTDQKSVFTVNSGKSAALLGLNITGGYITSGLQTGIGGGLLNLGTTALTDCRLSGNTATFGAAATSYAEFAPARLTLRRCTVSGNTAASNGGGLLNWAQGNAADLRVEDCAVTGNFALNVAGGLYNFSGGGVASFTALRTTVSGNSADGGAGSWNASFGSGAVTMTLTHCTLSGNIAGSYGGGGCYNWQNTGIATLTLADTIVAGNSASSAVTGPDIFKDDGTITSLGGNLIGKTDGSGTTWLGSDLTGTGPTPRDPLLAPLGDYGGPTQTMALLPGSPARNAAVGSLATSDQRGFPIVGGTPDIGAYEAGNQLANIFNAYIWETLPTAGNGTITDPLHAAGFDFDRDGASNLNEWLALTNAADPLSLLTLSISQNGSFTTLTFPTQSGRRYWLEYSDAFVTWDTVGNSFLGDGQPFVLTTDFLVPRAFFRVRIGL